jgi:signal transduction histidine kinase
MSSRWSDRLRPALALRLGLWYGLLFVVSASALVGITYVLLARSLEARDHEIIASTLDRYVGEYELDGLGALNRAISADRVEGRHERLFVRVLGREAEAIFFNIPAAWNDYDLSELDRIDVGGSVLWTRLPGRRGGTVLDVASARLPDGTLMQVGRSSDAREELLDHFRSRVLLVFALIVTIAAAGGVFLTYVGLAPVRRLSATVGNIVRTGRLDQRVSVRPGGDALEELGVLVNGMLDRIQFLIAGMRGALDNVAHDLRTPLMRLRGVVEAGLASNDSAAHRDALESALEESERVNSMLTTLMDISEAETGTMRLSPQRVRLADVVGEACDLYADLAEEKGVVLDVEVLAGLDLVADPVRLRQVVANLIDNAIKYTPAGGRVSVRGHGGGAEITLEVVDTGVGIDAVDLPRVWERLYRADASRSERGLGLGLSLVKAIVEAHGGRVSVSSTPGKGATFQVRFPAELPASGHTASRSTVGLG